MTMFTDVGEFHESLGLPGNHEVKSPHLLSNETFRYRLACLNEEIAELTEAHATNDLEAFADALADIAWFVLGTAHLAHIPFDSVWDEVRRANMEKRRWQEGDPLKPRNGTTSIEVVKPRGWKPPDIEKVLAARFRYINGLGGD